MIAIPAVIAKEARRAIVVRDQDIQVAIVIEIGIGRTARDHRAQEGRTHAGADVFELPAAEIVKQQWGFGIADLGLHAPDFVFDMAVSREDIGVAIQIVIEKESAESQREQAGAAHG